MGWGATVMERVARTSSARRDRCGNPPENHGLIVLYRNRLTPDHCLSDPLSCDPRVHQFPASQFTPHPCTNLHTQSPTPPSPSWGGMGWAAAEMERVARTSSARRNRCGNPPESHGLIGPYRNRLPPDHCFSGPLSCDPRILQFPASQFTPHPCPNRHAHSPAPPPPRREELDGAAAPGIGPPLTPSRSFPPNPPPRPKCSKSSRISGCYGVAGPGGHRFPRSARSSDR